MNKLIINGEVFDYSDDIQDISLEPVADVAPIYQPLVGIESITITGHMKKGALLYLSGVYRIIIDYARLHKIAPRALHLCLYSPRWRVQKKNLHRLIRKLERLR